LWDINTVVTDLALDFQLCYRNDLPPNWSTFHHIVQATEGIVLSPNWSVDELAHTCSLTGEVLCELVKEHQQQHEQSSCMKINKSLLVLDSGDYQKLLLIITKNYRNYHKLSKPLIVPNHNSVLLVVFGNLSVVDCERCGSMMVHRRRYCWFCTSHIVEDSWESSLSPRCCYCLYAVKCSNYISLVPLLPHSVSHVTEFGLSCLLTG